MGIMFDKLPYKEELKAWIAAYGSYSNVTTNEEPASLNELMKFWEDAKSKTLYDMLGKNFIVEKKVSFTRRSSEIEDIMYESRDMRNFMDKYTDWVLYESHFDEIIRHRLMRLCGWNTLADNEYTGQTFKITIGDKTIAIQSGCKPSRIIGKIANAANIEGFERFRIAHSMALDKKHTTGTLCISIHPLDYLTMSDNEYDWESCMNWRNGGCYRMGTVEMMNSPYVVVAYLKGDNKVMRYYDHEWNSKKWRNLFIVTPQCITGIKGYPYQSTELDEATIHILKELVEENLGYKYGDTIYEHHFNENSEEVDLEDSECECHTINFNFETGFMYNDFGNDNITHFILNPVVLRDEEEVYCYYSGKAECMYSGHEIDGWDYDINEADEVICNKYMNRLECCCCGTTTSEEFELDGDYYCEDCYYEYRSFDPFEGEYHHRDNMHELYLVSSQEELEQHKDDEDYFVSNFPRFMIYDDWAFENYNRENNPIHKIVFKVVNTIWNYEFNKRYDYVIKTELSDKVIDIIEKSISGYYD